MRGLKYFMWGYQPHFQVGVQIAFKDLLQDLGLSFDSRVFLLGVLRNEF